MKRNLSSALLIVILINLLARISEAIKSPSIILMLNDDQGFGEGENSKLLQQPNLHKLVNEGMTLNRTYTRTICAPSRWAIFVGENTIADNGFDGMFQLPAITLAGELRKQGYKTAMYGKWGFGSNQTLSPVMLAGFDDSLIYTTHIAAHATFPSSLEQNGNVIIYPKNRLATRKRCLNPAQCTYGPDLFLAKSLKFIEDNNNSKFFLALTLNLPHVGIYQKDRPTKFTSPVVTCQPKTCNINNFALVGHESMLENYVDKTLGAILNKLEKLQAQENTILVYTSDNGAPNILNFIPRFNSNGDLRGWKGLQYEGGVRVPGVVWGPGRIPANTVSNYPVDLQNLIPTFTEFAGKKVTKPTSSVSYYDLWTNGDSAAPAKPRKPISLELCKGNIDSACSYAYYNLDSWPQKVFKLLNARQGLGVEFFEVMSDPNEKNNLATLPQYNNTIAAMQKERLQNRIPVAPPPKLNRV